ncbi:MAG: hypothetical protein LBP59_13735 [Planctomycetaceae bacterium]|nr:hypothetical protein [Planctomycetaceae bacterium]
MQSKSKLQYIENIRIVLKTYQYKSVKACRPKTRQTTLNAVRENKFDQFFIFLIN